MQTVSDHLRFFQMLFTVSTGMLCFFEAILIASVSDLPEKISFIIRSMISIIIATGVESDRLGVGVMIDFLIRVPP